MVWEQDTRLVLALSSIDSQECRPFWPSMIGETLFWDTNKRGEQLRLTLLEELDTFAKRSIRLNLELCVSMTLFINKRFALNERFQHNASKFAIFYV